MSYTKKAVRGISWVVIFHLAASVMSYLTRVILARSLTPSEYGLFYSVFTFVMFFMFFRDLGLNQAVAKYIPEFKIKEKYGEIKSAITAVVFYQLLSSLIFCVVFFVCADILAEKYFKSPEASFILKVLIVYVVTSVIFRAMKGTFHGFQSMHIFASGEFVKNVVILLGIVGFLALGYKTLTPLYAYTISFPILIVIYAPFMIKQFNFFKYKIKNFKEVSKKMILFGIPVFATAVGSKVIGYIDTLILTYYTTAAQVGIYNVILPTALILLFLGTAVSSTLFPMSSELWAKNDKKRLGDGLRLLQRYVFILSIPILGVVFTFSEQLIQIFFGKEYATGALSLQILLIGILFYSLGLVNNNIIAGIGKPKTVTKIILFSAVLNVAINIFLIPTYGITGAAIATTISYFVVFIMSTARSTIFIETKPPIKDWVLLSIPTAVFFFILYNGKTLLNYNFWVEIILLSIIASIFYLVLLFVLRIVNIEEIKKYSRLAIK